MSDGLSRGGFWRRALASIVNTLLVGLPLLFAGAVLFALTGGAAQYFSGPFKMQSCAPAASDVIEKLKPTLTPPPPDRWNVAQSCSNSFFGMTAGRWLVVSRVEQSKSEQGIVKYESTTSISQGYALNANGEAVPGFDWSWLADLLWLAYLIIFLSLMGRTPGMLVTGLRMISVDAPMIRAVPFTRLCLRAFWMLLPTLGVLLVFGAALLWLGGLNSDWTGALTRVRGLYLLFFVPSAIAIWVLVDVSRKADPYYDRLAGTAVVRVT